MAASTDTRSQLYQFTVIFSVLFALVGFSYNVWRMEVTEKNSNIRMACFEMLRELSALEQLVYAAHYDKNTKAGNPRVGWIKVGLIHDLSNLTTVEISGTSKELKTVWQAHWNTMIDDAHSVTQIVDAIDSSRAAISETLQSLQ